MFTFSLALSFAYTWAVSSTKCDSQGRVRVILLACLILVRKRFWNLEIRRRSEMLMNYNNCVGGQNGFKLFHPNVVDNENMTLKFYYYFLFLFFFLFWGVIDIITPLQLPEINSWSGRVQLTTLATYLTWIYLTTRGFVGDQSCASNRHVSRDIYFWPPENVPCRKEVKRPMSKVGLLSFLHRLRTLTNTRRFDKNSLLLYLHLACWRVYRRERIDWLRHMSCYHEKRNLCKNEIMKMSKILADVWMTALRWNSSKVLKIKYLQCVNGFRMEFWSIKVWLKAFWKYPENSSTFDDSVRQILCRVR